VITIAALALPPQYPLHPPQLQPAGGGHALRLRIASFNLRGADIDDGTDSWLPRRRHVCWRALRQLSAPIVGVQEGHTSQVKCAADGSR
jgi:hypothetical protein